MVIANVKVIEDLQQFLHLCCDDPHLRGLFTVSESDFTRKRKLPMKQVVLLLLNVLKRSLNMELEGFFTQALPCPHAPATKGAFCQQRLKLKPFFFTLWNEVLTNSFYRHYEHTVKTWKGLRVLAVDSTTAFLLNKEGLKEHFGVQSNQHADRVMARIVQVEDVLNGLTLSGTILPSSASEVNVACEMAHRFFSDSVTVFDRGYAGYGLMYVLQHQETPRKFLIRCSTGANTFKEIGQFVRRRCKEQVVTLYPSRSAITRLKQYGYIVNGQTPLEVRMVKVKLSSGQTEVLLTNVMDTGLCAADFAALYHLRWRIETKFYRQKMHMALEEFSGHSVQSIEQDYGALVLLLNIHQLILKQSTAFLALKSTNTKHYYQINESVSVSLMKNTVVRLMLQHQSVHILLELQNLFERYLEPKRGGREYPRTTKHKRTIKRHQSYSNFKRNI